MTSVEVCAGAGGQALGLETAGFQHLVLAELDKDACTTLRLNRPAWNVKNIDIRDLRASDYRGADLFAGGLPCPPFSVAGKQLGAHDERNLFPVAFELINDCRPSAVMIENVRGLLDPRFVSYREWMNAQFEKLG